MTTGRVRPVIGTPIAPARLAVDMSNNQIKVGNACRRLGRSLTTSVLR
jgi:hypothetical protein